MVVIVTTKNLPRILQVPLPVTKNLIKFSSQTNSSYAKIIYLRNTSDRHEGSTSQSFISFCKGNKKKSKNITYEKPPPTIESLNKIDLNLIKKEIQINYPKVSGERTLAFPSFSTSFKCFNIDNAAKIATEVPYPEKRPSQF